VACMRRLRKGAKARFTFDLSFCADSLRSWRLRVKKQTKLLLRLSDHHAENRPAPTAGCFPP
jgi:hypothetical protein